MMFRSDVVGSLLRPDYLMRRAQSGRGGGDRAGRVQGIEDRAVDEAIQLQQTPGSTC